MLSRRGFLSRAALSAGALVLPTGLFTLTASGCGSGGRRTNHYYVFYLMVGGWDLMFTTDPASQKKGDFYVPYDDDEMLTVGDLRLGPSMKPLLPFSRKMGILKGIHVDALNHPQARFRMVTGKFKPPGNRVTAPSVQTLIAQHKGSAYELPNLSSDALRPATFRGDVDDLRLEPVRVSSVDQLRHLTMLRGDVAKSRKDIEAALREKDALTTKQWNSSSLPAEFERFANLERDLASSDYRDRVRASTSMVDDANRAISGKPLERQEKQVRLAVEAIKQDLAPVVTVGSGEFDAHSKIEYASHQTAVSRGIKAVADIAHGLEAVGIGGGRTLLDMTTIVVTSEFSRTPSKNELGGKHHWPTNSMLLIGKGVRRGENGQPRVFGRVDENMVALPVNPRNGSSKRGADVLDMSHGLATILALGGIDPIKAMQQEPVLDLLG